MCDEMISPSVIILETGWAYQFRWCRYIIRTCQHETIIILIMVN